MNTFYRNKLVVLSALMLLVFLATPMIGLAQDPFSSAPSGKQMAENATATANSFSVLIQSIVCLVGFVITCAGIYGFYRVNKEQGQGRASIATSLAGCVVGVCMILLPLTIGTLGKSLFGDQMARPTRIDITPR